MIQRLKTALVLVVVVAIFFVARFWQNFVFDFLILTISLMGSFEVLNGFNMNKKPNYMYLIFIFNLVIYFSFSICTLVNLNIANLLLIILGLLVSFSLISLLLPYIMKKTTKKEYLEYSHKMTFDAFCSFKSFNTILVFIYPTILCSSLYFINNISNLNVPILKNKCDLGLFLLLIVFAISVMTDTMAYFVGRMLKGPKLAPKVSPNKTISGSVGGLIGGIIGSLVIFGIFNTFAEYKLLFDAINLNYLHIAMIGMLGSISTQCGDLLESYIKRQLNLKDFGNIFPGHGGVMDRIDGLSLNSLFIALTFILALV